jgi:hypothetical protein
MLPIRYSEGRFYRCFLMLKSSVDLLEGLLPILEVNGTYMKSIYYNGMLKFVFWPLQKLDSITMFL